MYKRQLAWNWWTHFWGRNSVKFREVFGQPSKRGDLQIILGEHRIILPFSFIRSQFDRRHHLWQAQEKSEVDYYNEILNLLLDIDLDQKKIQIKKRMIEISEILNIPSPYEMKKDFD